MDVDAWMRERAAYQERLRREAEGKARKQRKRDASRDAVAQARQAYRERKERCREMHEEQMKVARAKALRSQSAKQAKARQEAMREFMKREGLVTLQIRRDPRGEHIQSSSGYTRPEP